MKANSRQAHRFHEPLEAEDARDRTVGCRHTSPIICRKNGMPGVCAFVTDDGICLAPPLSWAKQYEKLMKQKVPQ